MQLIALFTRDVYNVIMHYLLLADLAHWTQYFSTLRWCYRWYHESHGLTDISNVSFVALLLKWVSHVKGPVDNGTIFKWDFLNVCGSECVKCTAILFKWFYFLCVLKAFIKWFSPEICFVIILITTRGCCKTSVHLGCRGIDAAGQFESFQKDSKSSPSHTLMVW